jgi:GT2 family glycosyltransferase
MTIDIIIVNFRSFHDVAQCMTHLGSWPHGIVWVVDNSHDSREAEQLRAAFTGLSWVRVLIAPMNLGFGQGCNLAFSQSTAELLLLLNPDARITTDSICMLAQSLQSEPRLAAVSPRMYWNKSRGFLLPLASVQSPRASLISALTTRSHQAARLLAERQLGRMKALLRPSVAPFEVPFLAGSVLLLRRAAVLKAGGLFDPEYFMFFEDTDLSLRLRKAGYSLAMVPAACAEHEYRHKAFKSSMMTTSHHQYLLKHFSLFYRWSGRLTRVAALARPIDTASWFRTIPAPINNAQEFAEYTDGGRVLAFSPSLLMTPALFRPSFAEAPCFSEEEWSLLEPACYVALVQSTTLTRRPEWIHFERAAV